MPGTWGHQPAERRIVDPARTEQPPAIAQHHRDLRRRLARLCAVCAAWAGALPGGSALVRKTCEMAFDLQVRDHARSTHGVKERRTPRERPVEEAVVRLAKLAG